MNPVQKALWFVESHLREPASLESIAGACGVSGFHLTRAFAASTGLSLMRYVRARRLSEAARTLALGAGDILAVALDAGYGSHEAFTRAFREQFGLTPEQVRARGPLHELRLQEPITMPTTPLAEVTPQRYETLPALQIVGFAERHDSESPGGIPAQWERLAPMLGHIPGQVGPVAYGVVDEYTEDGTFRYLTGVEVGQTLEIPDGMTSLRLAPQRYAVFHHDGHIAGIRALIAAIWTRWLPESGHQPTAAPTFERYGPEFDGRTGTGGFEVWIPIGSA